MQILWILYKRERDSPIADKENDLQRAIRIWHESEPEVRIVLGIGSDLLRSLLVRIQRSGCTRSFRAHLLAIQVVWADQPRYIYGLWILRSLSPMSQPKTPSSGQAATRSWLRHHRLLACHLGER